MLTFDSLKGFVNGISGLGGTGDKGSYGTWYFSQLTQDQIEAAYRGNWMARKAVDVPVFDALREGWAWQAEADDIEAIEEEERRLGVLSKLRKAKTWARLYGGAAILIGDGSPNPSEPLVLDRVGRGGLQYLTVLDRSHITPGEIELDPGLPGFMMPRDYAIPSGRRFFGGDIRVHPSRVIPFLGAERPGLTGADGWGDSVLDAIELVIRDATAGQQGIAALVQEAKVDVFKIPGLSENLATQAYETRLINRFALTAKAKSLVNAVILDGEEEWEQKQISFATLPEIQQLMLQMVSGAADIPATRFLGQSPTGLQATGESDIRNYYDRIGAEQEMQDRPAFQQLFDVVVRSALGSYPDDIHFTFNPLWQMSQKEAAEVGKLEAETEEIHVRTGLVPMPVMQEAVRNRLIERGQNPGIEAAYEDFGDLTEEMEPPMPGEVEGPEGDLPAL